MQHLFNLIESENIRLVEDDIPYRVRGLYFDSIIVLHKNIDTAAERNSILAEELGHHFTSSGNILNQSSLRSLKQENSARRWAAEQMIKPDRIIDAFKSGVRSRLELSQYLDVTETFIEESLVHMKKLYGDHLAINEYIIHFDPLWVYKSFD